MGKTMVESFLLEEANVSYCARSATGTEFDDFHKTLPSSNSARAVGAAVDVSSKKAIHNWVNKSAEKFGRIDCVIANGTSDYDNSPLSCVSPALTFPSSFSSASPMHMEGTTEAWTDSFNVDVMGAVNLIDAATPSLEKSPSASVIIQSSFMGREFYRSPPAAYGPCKAAQLQHVQELSQFLGPKGIRVNAISPGPILCKDGPWEKYMKLMPEWVEEQRLKIPLKRLGGPQEIAHVALFLASSLSSFVSGTNVLADGGIHVGTQF